MHPERVPLQWQRGPWETTEVGADWGEAQEQKPVKMQQGVFNGLAQVQTLSLLLLAGQLWAACQIL